MEKILKYSTVGRLVCRFLSISLLNLVQLDEKYHLHLIFAFVKLTVLRELKSPLLV